LHTIESHLNRLSDIMSRGMIEDASSVVPSRLSSRSASKDDDDGGNEGDGDGDDDDISSGATSPLTADLADVQVFHNHADMVERCHGPSSLFVLCNHFRLRALAANGAEDHNNNNNHSAALQDMLQNLCQIAGSTEPFPSYSDQTAIKLLPKQHAMTAVEHFIQHVDCTTDLFVPGNLRAQLDRVYESAAPAKPGDDVWMICFKVITLLVLGMEISTQAPTVLVGDFARSLLPSRASLVNSRLLTTPRLINVQTLVLLVGIHFSFHFPFTFLSLRFTSLPFCCMVLGLVIVIVRLTLAALVSCRVLLHSSLTRLVGLS
jgi:hypothetical protein